MRGKHTIARFGCPCSTNQDGGCALLTRHDRAQPHRVQCNKLLRDMIGSIQSVSTKVSAQKPQFEGVGIVHIDLHTEDTNSKT